MSALLAALLKAAVTAAAALEKGLTPFLARGVTAASEQVRQMRARDFLLFLAVLGLAGAAAALAVGAVIVVHLLLGRRRGRVFISFHHERQGIADKLVAAMGNAGLHCFKLPFVDDPQHDTLLDSVRAAIRSCDVFVCVPGDRPSFVEHEVSMAFGLAKPLVFVVVAEDTPRLPNTAKKRYPVFMLEGLEAEGFGALVKFCSYLAGDWRSTLRLYAAVFSHI